MEEIIEVSLELGVVAVVLAKLCFLIEELSWGVDDSFMLEEAGPLQKDASLPFKDWDWSNNRLEEPDNEVLLELYVEIGLKIGVLWLPPELVMLEDDTDADLVAS